MAAKALRVGLGLLGLASPALGLDHIVLENLPYALARCSTVRVHSGLDGTGRGNNRLDNAGGNAPEVHLFNDVGKLLGRWSEAWYKIREGSFRDMIVEQKSYQQPTYGLFTAGKDAICIAFVAVTAPDQGKYGWVGDWAHACGHSWYLSGIQIDQRPLDCSWIDSNGDSGPETAFQVHFPDFNARHGVHSEIVNTYCNNPTFKYYTKPKYGTKGEHVETWSEFAKRGESNSTQRAPVQRRSKMTGEDRIVVSHLPGHAATTLCESETSLGPDFVSIAEGLFCNMDSRTLHKLCRGQDKFDCFDVDSKQLHGADGKVKRANIYSRTIEWAHPITVDPVLWE